MNLWQELKVEVQARKPRSLDKQTRISDAVFRFLLLYLWFLVLPTLNQTPNLKLIKEPRQIPFLNSILLLTLFRYLLEETTGSEHEINKRFAVAHNNVGSVPIAFHLHHFTDTPQVLN